jgi:hypothetical protein
MSLERAAMRGKLADARMRAKKLSLRIEGNCTAIRQGLNTALTPVADLAVPQLAEQMDELVGAWAELQATLAEIARLERELA